MTGVGWRCVEAASGLLDPRDREVVLGDLAESSDGLWQGLTGVMGLAIRRQALQWTSWRPWLVAFGLAWPGSLFLMGFSLSVSRGIQRLVETTLLHNDFNAHATPVLAFHALLLVIWSWTGGFVVGSVSRRTLWASIALCCLPSAYCMAEFPTGLLSSSCLFVFLVPAILGAREGSRGVRIRPGLALAAATAATVLVVPAWGWGSSCAYSLALVWPGWYLAATANWGNSATPMTQKRGIL